MPEQTALRELLSSLPEDSADRAGIARSIGILESAEEDHHKPRNVIAAIAAIMRELPGIGKGMQSVGTQGYKYRGIEQITAEIQKLMGKYGVVFVPKVLSREVKAYTTQGGGLWTEDYLVVEYTVYGPGNDRSEVTLDVAGEHTSKWVRDCIVVGPIHALGRDNSDKGLNKCQPAGTLVRVPTGGKRGGHLDAFADWTEVPIETLLPGDRVVAWRRSGSTLVSTGRNVSGVAVRDYEGPLVTASVGAGTSRYTPDHHCLIRLGPLDEGNDVVYLMRRGNQFRVGRSTWIAVGPNRHGNPRTGLSTRAWAEEADALWILSVHDKTEDAALAEALTAHEFGIPETLFVGRSGSEYRMPLARFWSKIGDNSEEANACLHSFGLLPDAPLLQRPLHQESNWISSEGIAAANLRSGMLVPVPLDPVEAYEGTVGMRWPVKWTPVTVGREYHSGPVYSLNVDSDHNYIADGLITANCMTQAYKYALLQTFCIGDSKDDGDRDEGDANNSPHAGGEGGPSQSRTTRRAAPQRRQPGTQSGAPAQASQPNEEKPAGEQAPSQRSELITLRQLFDRNNIKDRDVRLEYCSKVVGRSVVSSNDLTKDEAMSVTKVMLRPASDWPALDTVPSEATQVAPKVTPPPEAATDAGNDAAVPEPQRALM